MNGLITSLFFIVSTLLKKYIKFMLFSKAASENIAVINCGENPYKTPVKKSISSKVEAVVLYVY